MRYYLSPANLMVVSEMNRTVNTHNKRSDIRRQLTGWGGLFLYALVLSPVGMVMLGILGTLDSDHHARLEFGAEGVQLVLRHDGACVRHQHQAAARVLTLFAATPSAANPDHVLQFRAANSLLREANPVLVAPNQTATSLVHLASPSPQPGVCSGHTTAPLHPPPAPVAPRHCGLRSTVLLI